MENQIVILVLVPAAIILMAAIGLSTRQSNTQDSFRPILPDLAHRTQKLIDEGKLIEAIKLVRSETQWGLRESKAVVDAMKVGRDVTAENGSQTPKISATKYDGKTFVAINGQSYSYRIRELATTGKKIEALKLLREESGLSLKDAKTIIDKIQ